MFPLRLCGGKPLVAVTRERRYGPSRLRVNDDDDVDAVTTEDATTKSHRYRESAAERIDARIPLDGVGPCHSDVD